MDQRSDERASPFPARLGVGPALFNGPIVSLRVADLLARLRMRVRMLEKEDRHFFVCALTDVHATMNAVERFIPINLTGTDLDTCEFGSVWSFDR